MSKQPSPSQSLKLPRQWAQFACNLFTSNAEQLFFFFFLKCLQEQEHFFCTCMPILLVTWKGHVPDQVSAPGGWSCKWAALKSVNQCSQGWEGHIATPPAAPPSPQGALGREVKSEKTSKIFYRSLTTLLSLFSPASICAYNNPLSKHKEDVWLRAVTKSQTVQMIQPSLYYSKTPLQSLLQALIAMIPNPSLVFYMTACI